MVRWGWSGVEPGTNSGTNVDDSFTVVRSSARNRDTRTAARTSMTTETATLVERIAVPFVGPRIQTTTAPRRGNTSKASTISWSDGIRSTPSSGSCMEIEIGGGRADV